MRAARIIRFDLREGLRAVAPWLCAGAVLQLLCLLAALLNLAARGRSASLTLGEALAVLTMGSPEALPSASEPVQIPVEWMIVLLSLMYITLWYPHRDLLGFGRHVLTSCGSRRAWWLSKCIWVVCTVVLFWAMGYAIACVTALATSGSLSLDITEGLMWAFGWDAVLIRTDHLFVVLFAVCVIVNTAALSLVQMLISLVVHPMVGYVASVSLLILSVFEFTSPVLIGNLVMFARSSVLDGYGYDPVFGIGIGLAVAALAVVSGTFLISRKDILGREA